MKIRPILTEKSLKDAKLGQYSFWVAPNLNKHQIAILIGKAFGVNIISVKTQNRARRQRLNLSRKMVTVAAKKRAIVTLQDKQKIDLFDTGDKKKGTK
jgi:ribosomal protein L23